MADYFVQTTHPGTIQLDGDTATGRSYLSELALLRDGSSHLNYFVYHDRYQRTPDGWKFTERVAEFRYLNTTQVAGSAPAHRGTPADRPAARQSRPLLCQPLSGGADGECSHCGLSHLRV